MKKKKWSRPECKRVKLAPEEAVLSGCKNETISEPWKTPCVEQWSECSALGS